MAIPRRKCSLECKHCFGSPEQLGCTVICVKSLNGFVTLHSGFATFVVDVPDDECSRFVNPRRKCSLELRHCFESLELLGFIVRYVKFLSGFVALLSGFGTFDVDVVCIASV